MQFKNDYGDLTDEEKTEKTKKMKEFWTNTLSGVQV